jgi:C4-dicarboxylate-specific signal transduction histidine kinase
VAFEYSLSTDRARRFYDVRVVACGDHVLSLIRDVTDRLRAEHRARELHNELAHAGRVMALGTLTGAIVHEINQPLTAIRTNAHVVLRLLEAPPPEPGSLREVMLDIVSDLRRVDAILGRLRQLLRKERRAHAPVDLNALVEDVVKLVRGEFLRRRIALDVALAPGLPPVVGDPIQLQQVVLNILMNAAEAVGAGADGGERHVTLTTERTDTRVVVSVIDRGPGVPDEELTRIFEPFVTTKRGGMGLGLAICRRIIDAHGGEIGVRRNVDRGLTCWFALEVASAGTGRVADDA